MVREEIREVERECRHLFERLSHEAEQRNEVQLETDVVSKEDFFF